ncbi:MAG: hypothetical protein Q9192_001393 [Flavoplaca navasiana]
MVNVSSYLASQQRRPPAITGKNLWREEVCLSGNQRTENHPFPTPAYEILLGKSFSFVLTCVSNFHGVPPASYASFFTTVKGCCELHFEAEATLRHLEACFKQCKLLNRHLQLNLIELVHMEQSMPQPHWEFRNQVNERHRENWMNIVNIMSKKSVLEEDLKCFVRQAQAYHREARCLIRAFWLGERLVPREVGFVPDGHLALRGREESGIVPFTVMQRSLRQR